MKGKKMKGPHSQRWTPEDRKRLAELASLYASDYKIAQIMKRKPSAVSWQRRVLRIRLHGAKPGRKPGCAAWLENVNYPTLLVAQSHRRYQRRMATVKFPASGESAKRVDRLLALVGARPQREANG